MVRSVGATPAAAQSSPLAVIVTSVPPTYGPVALSRCHISVICSGFSPTPSALLRQSRHPASELSNINLRNVPEPLVYTSGNALNSLPSLDAETCAVPGEERVGVTTCASLSLTYVYSTSSIWFSLANRICGRRERGGGDRRAR